MSWMPRKLAVGIALLALCTGCGGLFGRSIEQELPTPTPIPTPIIPDEPTYTVQRGQVTKEQEFVGRISPVEEINLYFKRSGYVKQVSVRQGDMVRAGDLLAELEIDDLLGQAAQARMNLQSAELRLDAAEDALGRQVAEAELVLEAAQIKLAELQQDPEPVQVELLRLAWERAKNALWSAQAQRDSVMAQEDVPSYLRDQAQAAVANAEIAVQEAQLRYQQGLQPAASQYEVRLQQIEVKQAQQELDWLKAGVDPVLVNAVDQAKLTLERLEAQVSDAQAVAPIDGRVLSVAIYAGRQAEAFKPAIVVADPMALEVSALLVSSQMEGMLEGQKANVTLSSYPGEAWQGTVRLLPYPYGSGGSSERLPDADPSVRISLQGDLSKLELGDLARVVIIIEEKDDVLWLPPQAVRSFQGRNFVIVQDGDRQRRVDVSLGIQGKTRVEILQGLEENQVVIAP